MRRLSWLLLALAGCAGPDGDPVKVAERFHARLSAGDDPGIHTLLTEEDRTAVPLDAFPEELPSSIALALLARVDTRLDSAALARADGDTAAVVLHIAGSAPDTLRLLAVHDPLTLWRFELDRVRWRVSMRLAERAALDSLAAALRADGDASGLGGVEAAKAYLVAADRDPALAHPAALSAARSAVRRADIADALRIRLRVTESFTGAVVVEGRIENPTRSRIGTLRLTLRDRAGREESVEFWQLEPGSTLPVRQITATGSRTARPHHR